MTDRFSGNAPSVTGPASHGFSITPNDDADLPETTRAIYCGQGGNLTVTLASGASLTFSNLPDGAFLPLRLLRVAATGTTAQGLIGLA
jgi:hypothetical protein